MKHARYIWDFALGVILIAGVPMIFSAIAGGGIKYYESHHGTLPLVLGWCWALLYLVANLGLFVCTIRFRYRHRLLPKGYIVGETLGAMVFAGILALCWLDTLLHAGMITFQD
jgi:hypothetical protein